MKIKGFLKSQLWALAILALGFASCESDDNATPEYLSLKGNYLVCQGSMGKTNGAVSLYSDAVNDANIFKSVNGKDLGDVVQSFAIVDTLGFIVVNNSQKVEIVRMRDFKSVGTIKDLSYPRYVIQATENTIYISNGKGDGSESDEVVEYDFRSMKVVSNIKVGKGPEVMAKVGDKVYVANSGGYGDDNTVSVIDVNSHDVTTITTAYGGVDMEVDYENNVWLYCNGGLDDSWQPIETAKLIKIDSKTDKIAKTFEYVKKVQSWGSNLIAMSADKRDIYFTVDNTYKMSVNADELPTEQWAVGVYYGIDVDPSNGDVYVMDSDFNKMKVLNTDSSIKKEYENTLIYPHMVVFNK
ncbi:hypothetical protein DMA11_21655 [Marinilabiliaceae bacterium JC017]|nr:hypothetical protein DMA11_21655 [Marinilabiliaceae bacterium JC017]